MEDSSYVKNEIPQASKPVTDDVETAKKDTKKKAIKVKHARQTQLNKEMKVRVCLMRNMYSAVSNEIYCYEVV